MASNARCIFFLLLTLSLSFQTHARDSKFFSKVSKKSHESISVAPAQAPTLSPSPSPEPEPQVIEHGYGLYGQEASYTPPTTKVGGEGEQDMFELSKNNYFNEKQGMSDTRFLENGKYYYDPNHDNVKDQSSYFQNNNDSFEEDNNEEEEENNAHFNTNSFENENSEDEFEDEDKKNGRYHQYGHNNARFEVENNENENLEAEKRGMSDTRFLENGKYYYDVQNDKYGNNHLFNNLHNNNNNNNMFNNLNNNNNNNKFVAEDVGFHSSNNVEYANTYNGYETQGRGGYNDNRNEYGYNNNVKPKKFANVYDSMEEYDREQGYIDGQDNQYVP